MNASAFDRFQHDGEGLTAAEDRGGEGRAFGGGGGGGGGAFAHCCIDGPKKFCERGELDIEGVSSTEFTCPHHGRGNISVRSIEMVNAIDSANDFKGTIKEVSEMM